MDICKKLKLYDNKNKFNPRYDTVPNVRFSLRLTKKLDDELGRYAQKSNISINTLILKCIEYALENFDLEE